MPGLPFDYAAKNLGRRPLRTLLTGGACALVAATLVGTASFVGGMKDTFAGAGRDDVAILLSSVAERDVLRSTVPLVAEGLVAADVAGIARIGGQPAVSAEIHLGTNLTLVRPQATGAEPELKGFVRGVTPTAFFVHDAVTVIEGAPPRTGEVIVGRAAAAKLGVADSDLAIGRQVRFEGATYTISGRFAAPGTTIESELWTPLQELKGQVRRDDASALFVKLERPDALSDLEVFCKRRLDLELVAIRSSVYYRELAAYFAPLRGLAWIMALLIALAVLATGANTLNTAVQDRVRELATLRAVGYTGFALARSLALEALLLAASGGLAGLALARIAVAGASFRLGMSAFRMEVTPGSVLLALGGVLVVGLIGTAPAAWRVLRLPVATALKES